MMNAKKFVIEDKDGRKHKYDMIFTFEDQESQKNYVVFTDGAREADGSMVIYAAIYDPEQDQLFSIETEEEWEKIDKILKTLQKMKQEEQ